MVWDDVANGQPGGSHLEEACSIVAAGEGRVLQQLLCDLAVELAGGLAEVALHVDQLLQLVKGAIHLEHRHLLPPIRVGPIEEPAGGTKQPTFADPRTLIELEPTRQNGDVDVDVLEMSCLRT